MNSITDLLDLEDADIFISDISISGTQKILTLETRPETHFCPICGFKMHSRGLKTRTINHPVLQDTYVLDTFDRYVKMDRLPLTDIIFIDEVFLELDEHCKYALVIQDFYTGNPIDLLSSRRTYFLKICHKIFI